MPVKITVNDDIEVASSAFEFYNCAAVVKRSENTPWVSGNVLKMCLPYSILKISLLTGRLCVPQMHCMCNSKWGCQWNIQDHTCSDKDDTVKGDHIIQHKEVSHVRKSACIYKLICCLCSNIWWAIIFGDKTGLITVLLDFFYGSCRMTGVLSWDPGTPAYSCWILKPPSNFRAKIWRNIW